MEEEEKGLGGLQLPLSDKTFRISGSILAVPSQRRNNIWTGPLRITILKNLSRRRPDKDIVTRQGVEKSMTFLQPAINGLNSPLKKQSRSDFAVIIFLNKYFTVNSLDLSILNF